VLVSESTGDDAAVYLLPGQDRLALLQTVDFFTPIVDDPHDWGRVAAANAFSDVYAMGGRPVTALNLVAWPIEELSAELLALVLEGGAAVAREAGVSIVGGHSIRDREPKYGMAVTGLVHADRIVRNSTMRPGDRLVLTKPLGTGIVSTAIKAGRASGPQVAAAVASMAALNREASEAMLEVGVSAATDVTGFGLLGHLHVALRGAGVAAVVDAASVPFLPGVGELARAGMIATGTRSNHAFVASALDWGGLTELEQLVLADAQTSGGLLIAVAPERAASLGDALRSRGIAGAEVGFVREGGPGAISLMGRPAI
jgi:selenide, water dikinase